MNAKQNAVLTTAQTALSHVPEGQLRNLYAQWKDGRTKVDIERVAFGLYTSHGKAITAAWRKLGLETEKPHPLVLEVTRLRALLLENGINPDA